MEIDGDYYSIEICATAPIRHAMGLVLKDRRGHICTLKIKPNYASEEFGGHAYICIELTKVQESDRAELLEEYRDKAKVKGIIKDRQKEVRRTFNALFKTFADYDILVDDDSPMPDLPAGTRIIEVGVTFTDAVAKRLTKEQATLKMYEETLQSREDEVDYMRRCLGLPPRQ